MLNVHLVWLTSSPLEEDATPISEGAEASWAECLRHIAVIREAFGPEPDGAELKPVQSEHEYGLYYEVACVFGQRRWQERQKGFMQVGQGATHCRHR